MNTALIMLWIRRRLESQAINKQVISRFILDWFVFVTWYTQPGVFKVTGGVAALLASCCVAKWIELVSVTGC